MSEQEAKAEARGVGAEGFKFTVAPEAPTLEKIKSAALAAKCGCGCGCGANEGAGGGGGK